MEPFARALVRWRWAVLVVWTVIGTVAAVRAPATPGLLNIRGGSSRETEASRTEKLLNERFARPIGEFFAVTLEGPSRFDAGPARVVLDTVLATLAREPYVRGLVSYPGTGDTTFLSRDRRATFVLVAIDLEDGDSAGAFVPPTREAVRRALAGAISAQDGWNALDRWRRLAMTRYAMHTVLDRAWELRENLSAYDAGYVALAEALDCALLTADARLSRAPGIRCPVTVLPR